MPTIKDETLNEIVCFLWKDEPETISRLIGMGKYFKTQAIMKKTKEDGIDCKTISQLLAYIRGAM